MQKSISKHITANSHASYEVQATVKRKLEIIDLVESKRQDHGKRRKKLLLSYPFLRARSVPYHVFSNKEDAAQGSITDWCRHSIVLMVHSSKSTVCPCKWRDHEGQGGRTSCACTQTTTTNFFTNSVYSRYHLFNFPLICHTCHTSI